ERTPISPAKQLDALLAEIEAFDLSKLTGMQKPRAEDIERTRDGKWKDLLTKGLCTKVFSGENAFRSKPIPNDLIALYQKLIQYARSALVGPLAEQTEATCEFLDRFHDELWALKQVAGALRFNEVTQAIVDALDRPALRPDALGFRLDGTIKH